MTMTKLQLYNGALRMCEERKLASLSEDREPRRLLDDVWTDDPIRRWLGAGQWQWATRTYMLDYDPDIEPDFGYLRAFAHPDDYVRTCAISAFDRFDPALTAFRDEAGYWFADMDVLYVAIVSDDDDYGRDYSKWPEAFSEYAQADLACKINPRLTGSRVATGDLMKERQRLLKVARGEDGVNRPTTFFSPGSWTNARRGTNFDRRRSPR